MQKRCLAEGGVCCADVQVTQESREAEDIQATVAEEEQAVGVQTAETAALKGEALA